MLQKDMRRRLYEHNWLDIRKKDHNPSQTLNRFGKQANEALVDLALLAKKLPEDYILRKIFTQKNLGVLLQSILCGNEPIYFVDEELDVDIDYNLRRGQLATLIVKIGIDFCIDQYKSTIEQSTILNEPVISQLSKASQICDEIVTKMYIPQMRKKIQKENLIYLFDGSKIIDTFEKSMDEIQNDNIKKFVDYCNGQLGVTNLPITRVQEISNRIYTDGVQEIEFNLVSEYGDNIIGRLVMDYHRVISTATLYDDQNNPKVDLVLRKENNGWYIYKRSN
ncbi:MAG TPA: hypothetical protein VH796_09280 [Nitrososphaeraceae archaeon]|jgi:hypothetical protein